MAVLVYFLLFFIAAKTAPPSCFKETLLTESAGCLSDITLGPDGNPIGILLTNDNTAHFLKCQDPDCDKYQLTNMPDLHTTVDDCRYNSIRMVSTADNPLFFIRTNGNIKLIHCITPTCSGYALVMDTKTSVDINLDHEFPAALEISPNGTTAILFYPTPQLYLNYYNQSVFVSYNILTKETTDIGRVYIHLLPGHDFSSFSLTWYNDAPHPFGFFMHGSSNDYVMSLIECKYDNCTAWVGYNMGPKARGNAQILGHPLTENTYPYVTFEEYAEPGILKLIRCANETCLHNYVDYPVSTTSFTDFGIETDFDQSGNIAIVTADQSYLVLDLCSPHGDCKHWDYHITGLTQAPRFVSSFASDTQIFLYKTFGFKLGVCPNAGCTGCKAPDPNPDIFNNTPGGSNPGLAPGWIAFLILFPIALIGASFWYIKWYRPQKRNYEGIPPEFADESSFHEM